MSCTDPYDIIEPEFRQLVLANVNLQCLSKGHAWTEGPVWFPAHQCLYFSDIPNERIMRWTEGESVTVFRANSQYSNGHTRDLEGRLISCQHGSRSVTRTEHDGTITTLADQYDGKRLNSPNDVVVKSDGTIWFTDPTYGIMSDYEGYRAEPEQERNRVYRLDPSSGVLTVFAEDFNQPNGLAFSVDESLLYVAESGKSHDPSVEAVIKSYDVASDGHPKEGAILAEIGVGVPDGFRVDTRGNIWTSAADGVHCFSPEGRLLGKIYVPETVSNLTFGGAKGNRLFITATSSVYAIYVNAKSANGR